MIKQMCIGCMVIVVSGALGGLAGCDHRRARASTVTESAQTQPPKPRVVEQVDTTPGRSISPQDQARVSSIAMRALVHIAWAQQALGVNDIDGAKRDVAQAGVQLAVLKKILPTVILIDHIQVAKTNLAYLNTTEVQQDLVTVMASLDQLCEVLPEGQAKGYARRAKAALETEKEKGAGKVKDALEAVEESLNFREVELSVSQVSRWLGIARKHLDKGQITEAREALTVSVAAVRYIDFEVVDPASVAAREVWLATQSWAVRNVKATKTRLATAKAALLEVVNIGDQSRQDQARRLIRALDALIVADGGDLTAKGLQELWQGARLLDTNDPSRARN
jgi:hypothetical protein